MACNQQHVNDVTRAKGPKFKIYMAGDVVWPGWTEPVVSGSGLAMQRGRQVQG